MKVEKLHVDGFGIFSDLTIDKIPKGLSVFYGRNEAGKTTLLAYFRSILFGFADGRTEENAYPPLKGGVHGGRMVLTGKSDEKYVVERQPGPHGGKLTVTLPSGETGNNALLQGLLGFASRELYRNVFAFSLRELQRFDSLNNASVSSAIYSAGAGTGLLSLPEVSRNLEREMGGMFKPGGTKPLINRLLKELEVCRKKIRQRSGRIDDYDGIREELARIEAAIEELQTSKEAKERQRERAEKRLQVWDEWVSLTSCEEELSALPDIPDFPADGASRLEALERNLEDLNSRIGKCKEEMDALELERDSLRINGAFLERESEIYELQRGRDHYDKAKADLPLRKQELELAERRVTETLQSIGPEWDVAKLTGFDASIPTREVIRNHRRDMEDAEKSMGVIRVRLEDAKKRLEDATRAEAECKKGLSLLEEPAEKDLKVVERQYKDSKRLRLLLSSQGRLHERLTYLEERRDDFEDQARRIEEKTERFGPVLPAYLIVPFGLLIALISVYIYLENLLAWAIAVGAVGTLVVVGYLLVGRHLAKRTEEEKYQLKNELRTIHDRLGEILNGSQDVRQELEGITGKVNGISQRLRIDPPIEEVSVQSMVERLEAEKERIRQWQSVAEQVDRAASARLSAKNAYDSIDADFREARNEVRRNRQAWEDWLSSRGLGTGVSPDGALEMVTKLEECRERQSMVDGLRNRIQLMGEEVSSYENRLSAISTACDLEMKNFQEAGKTMDLLFENLKTAQTNKSRREAIEDRRKGLSGELKRLVDERAQTTGKIRTLLKEGGATDGEDFRKRALVWETRSELQRRIRENTKSLERVGGRGRYLEAFKAALSETQPEEESVLKSQAEEALKRLSWELEQNLDNRGALREKLRIMETESDIGQLRLEEERLVARLNESAWKWSRLAVAQALLTEARARYERERQPAVIKDASAFFKEITKGRYSRILAPAGETTFHVLDRREERKRLEELSRGTREQLYLSVRFGLIEEFCRHHEPLPMVLDDIFVNFDRRRALAGVQVISRLAKSHQIFVFTCHEDTCRLITEADPSTPVFRMQDGCVTCDTAEG